MNVQLISNHRKVQVIPKALDLGTLEMNDAIHGIYYVHVFAPYVHIAQPLTIGR